MVSTSTVTGIPFARAMRAACATAARVVPIDVQQARAGYLFRRDLFGVDAQTFVAPPEDSTLAGGLIDHDVGRLIRAVAPKLDVFEIEPEARKLSIWMRPRSSSPTAPMYFARRPRRAQATIALATCPPGLRISRVNGALPA